VIKLSKIKEQKAYVIMAIIACCLLFSTIGIELNLIALPASASDAVAIGTVTAALALTIMMYSIAFIKKRKTDSTQTQTKPAINIINTPNKTPTTITPPTTNQKISKDTNKYLENYKTQQKTQTPTQPTPQTPNQTTTHPPNQPTPQTNNQTTSEKLTQLTTEKNATFNQETTKNKDKMTCPNCQKEYSMPLFSLDFSSSQPKLIRLCPYCNKPLDAQPKNTTEEALWNKYVQKP
jgi:hypothetical protein